MLGDKLSPIFEEIECVIINHNAFSKTPPKYTDDAFRAMCQIFMSGMMDKMYELQNTENIDFESRCKMAEKCGADLRQFIKTYTGIDTVKMYK